MLPQVPEQICSIRHEAPGTHIFYFAEVVPLLILSLWLRAECREQSLWGLAGNGLNFTQAT